MNCGINSKLKKKLNKHSGDLVISSISLAELMFGVENSKNKVRNLRNVLDFCCHVDVLFFDDKAAVEYGLLRAALHKKGKPIGPNDTLIAAHARSLDAILITNNSREYKRVRGLRIENWI